VKPDSSKKVYDGAIFELVVEQWGENEREIVVHPGSVAIVAVDREGYVTLVRQFREPARTELLEIPAGVIDDGEEALAAAQRELQEECGLTGGDWRHLGGFWTTPGFVRERMELFVATGLDRGEADPDDDEEVELVRWTRADVEAKLGEIEDAKTLAGLLLYLRLVSEEDTAESVGS
jgi:ADP-ribose pyrophosphatase